MGLFGNEKKKNPKNREDGFQPKRYHSAFYHRYFEGYVEVKRQKPNGKTYIERVYVGDYYEQALENWAKVVLRIFYVLLTALCLLFFVKAVFSAVDTNCLKVSAVIITLIVFSYIFLILALLNYVSAPFKMKVYEYKSSSKSFSLTAQIAGICEMLYLIFKIAYLWIHQGFTDKEIISLIFLSISFLITLVLYVVEKKIKYNIIKNELNGKIDGVQI